MPTSVCVLGGGALGLATAVHLVEGGLRDVTVLEADTPAAGSSGRSVGIIETQYVDPLDVELRVLSMRFFRRLQRDHGLHVSRIGYLRLAHTEAELAPLHESVQLQREMGIEDAEVLDRAGVQRLVPDLRLDDVAGGLWGPSDGYIDGHLYCGILARLTEAGGGRVLSGRRLRRATPLAGGGWRLATERGEEFRCDVVVDAAGPWAAKVGELLGVAIPLSPQRHQAVVIQLPSLLPYSMPMVMDYVPHTGREGLYFRHERADQLIAGLHTEEPLHDVVDPDSFRQDGDLSYYEAVAERLSDRLPGLSGASVVRGWAGIYPISPDGQPQVGPAGNGVILCAGPGGSGLQLSPVLGALAADWILHGEPRVTPSGVRLRPGRPSLATAAG